MRSIKRKLCTICAAAALVLLIAACGAHERDQVTDSGTASTGSSETDGKSMSERQLQKHSDEAPKGVLRLAWDSKFRSDYLDLQRYTSYIVSINMYDTLFETKMNEDGTTKLVNNLVEDYSISEDGRVFSFTLKEGLCFADGSPLTSEDVKFTFTRMLALPDGEQTAYGDVIVGAEAVMNHETDELEGVHVIDDRHFTIELSEPYPAYIELLATPPTGIYSKAFTEKMGDDYGKDPEHAMGSAPYMVESLTEEKCVLVVNPNYWGEKPNVEKVEIYAMAPVLVSRAFLDGEIDLLSADMTSVEALALTFGTKEWEDRKIVIMPVQMRSLFLNENYSFFNDVRVRKAIQMAVNRQRILDEVYNGNGVLLDGLYPRGLKGYDSSTEGRIKYDPEEARRLLKEAGAYESDDCRLELACNIEQTTSSLLVNKMVAEDLAAVGLNTILVNYSDDVFMHLRNDSMLMSYISSWTADFNDPANFIYTFFGTKNGIRRRSINYYNTDVIREIGAARSIVNEEDRLREYGRLEEQVIIEDAAMLPLFTLNKTYIRGDRVASFEHYWAGWESFYVKYVELEDLP